MREAVWILTLLLVGAYGARAQSLEEQMARNEQAVSEVLPEATSFVAEHGIYEHIRGYRDTGDGSEPELVGYVFFTKDIGARWRGYIGSIPILVGLDLKGRLTGVHILKHFEPYGYRSINLPEYAAQFEGKSVLDPFKVYEDVDGYSGATISVAAATRTIRHAARSMAREFLVKKSKPGGRE